MNKEAILVAFILFSYSIAFGQQTFSVKFDLGSGTLATALMEAPDGYLICGAGFDTTGVNHSDMFIYKIDQVGDSLQMMHAGEDDLEFYPKNKVHGTFSDGSHIIAYRQFNGTVFLCKLFWFNNDLDTTATQTIGVSEVNSSGDDFLEVRDLAVDYEDNFYLSLGLGNVDGNSENDYLIRKYTQAGDLLWDYYVAEPSDQSSICMVADSSGVIVSEAGFNGDAYYFKIRKINLDGTEGWAFPFEVPQPDDVTGAADILLDNGFLLIGSSGCPDSACSGLPALVAFDTLGNYHWHSIIEDTQHYFQFIDNVIRTCDGGYLASSRYHIPEIEGDTLGALNNFAAWLIRYDHEGNILWDRKYSIVNSAKYNHDITDLIATRDGGFLFCGEATDLWPENPDIDWPPQQAWVVKVDGCGCLVPGCDSLCGPPECDTTTTKIPPLDYFIYGPNPVNELLNIYLGDALEDDQQPVVYLYDLQGRLIDNFVVDHFNTTYIWNLSHLAQGQYLLSLHQGQTILQTETLVVGGR